MRHVAIDGPLTMKCKLEIEIENGMEMEMKMELVETGAETRVSPRRCCLLCACDNHCTAWHPPPSSSWPHTPHLRCGYLSVCVCASCHCDKHAKVKWQPRGRLLRAPLATCMTFTSCHPHHLCLQPSPVPPPHLLPSAAGRTVYFWFGALISALGQVCISLMHREARAASAAHYQRAACSLPLKTCN